MHINETLTKLTQYYKVIKSEVSYVNWALTKNYGFADGFGGSGGRGAFLCELFILEKDSTICIWFRDTSEAGSAPGEQKTNLVCSSKGC